MKVLRKQFVVKKPPDLRNVTVVLIDDDTTQFDICRDLLAETGAVIHCFSEAAEALSFIESNAVDIVLSDVMMPGMDGWELHSRVRSGERNPNVGFIFTTCLISSQQEPLMSDEYAHTLTLAKPLDSFKLFKAINRVYRPQ